MLRSSTLARDNSSVLRSRPIGLPRYQVNEKRAPRMPPPCSHWHPTELRAFLTKPVTCVGSASVWSVIPRHSGNMGPWAAFCVGAGDCGAQGEVDPELSEHAANTGIMAAAATASAFADRVLPVAHLLGVTPCTVAAAQYLNHRMPTDLLIYRILRWPCRTRLRRGRYATVTGCCGHCCDGMRDRTDRCSRSLRGSS